jgi:hypothetical protein
MNSEEQVRQAQANFKTITGIKEKLKILTEHVVLALRYSYFNPVV